MSYIERHIKKTRKKVGWNQSISFRVVILIFFASALVIGASGFVGYKYVEKTKVAEFENLASVTASRLSQHLVTPMWDVNHEGVGELLEAEMGESKLSLILVYDEDNNSIFAGRKRSTTGITSTKVGESIGKFSNSQVVSNGDKTLGRVDVKLSENILQNELWTFAKGITLAAIIICLVLTLVTSIEVSSMVVKPLKRLTDNAEQISRGDLRQEIDVSRYDEIGYLGSTIDRMQYALRLATTQLRKHMAEAA